MSGGADGNTFVDREGSSYDYEGPPPGDADGSTFAAREGSLYGYEGPSPVQSHRSSYYDPAGEVDVEPASLKDFATFLGDDLEAFREARRTAIDEFFDGAIPPFAGDRDAGDRDAAGGMPEGVGFMMEYFGRELAMQMFLNDVEMGLTALSMAALFIHSDYVVWDFFSGGTGDAGFAGYEAGTVTATFTSGGVDRSGGEEGSSDEPPEEYHDDDLESRWSDEEALAREQDALANQQPDEDIFGSGDLGFTGTTLHDGQAGEYAIENDADVQYQDLSRHLDFHGSGEAHLPNDGPGGRPAWEPDELEEAS